MILKNQHGYTHAHVFNCLVHGWVCKLASSLQIAGGIAELELAETQLQEHTAVAHVLA
jgi:hypothetical protein